MAQQIALRIHSDRHGLRTVALHPKAHLEIDEEDGYRRLHGLNRLLVCSPEELPTLAHLEGLRERAAILLLELPQRVLGGLLPTWDELVAQTQWARAHGMAVHLDGARLWEAAPWYGRDLCEISALFDTVYVSFYKGLGGIAGAALAGPADLVDEARIWQVRHGGRLASLYPLIIAARIGLDRYLPQMPAFYTHSVDVGSALAGVEGVDVVPHPPQTPLMHLYLRGSRERLVDAAVAVARERGVWLFRQLAPTTNPNEQMHELTIGEAALLVSAEEAASLFLEVVERARP
jgi:threonine aldolase